MDKVVILVVGLALGAGLASLAAYNAPGRTASASVCEDVLNELAEQTGSQNVVTDIHEGESAMVDFSTNSDARLFRTRIRDAVASGPNYAGRYAVASWGCGTSCQEHAVIDVRTGAVVSFGQLASRFGVAHDLRNRVLITNPAGSLPEEAETQRNDSVFNTAAIPREYYRIESDESGRSYLAKICVESAATRSNEDYFGREGVSD